MQNRSLVVLTTAILLSGCTTIQGAFDALDQESVEVQEPVAIGLANANRQNLVGLGNALASRGVPNCSAFVTSEGVPIERRNTTARCSIGSDNGLVGNEPMDAYIDRSIFVIDAYCDSYLTALAGMGESSRWTRSQFNTVANYVGVLMALAGEPTENIGYLNAATGFFNASADNLETFVLISPSPGKLGPLVTRAQIDKRSGLAVIRQGDPTLMWSATSRWLQEYAGLCTPRGIRLLVDDAVDYASPGERPLQLSDAARRLGPVLGVVLSSQGIAIDTATLNDPAKLGALAWWISDPNITDSQRNHVVGVLGAGTTNSLATALADTAKRQALTQVVNGPGSAAFEQLIRTAKAVEAAESGQEQARQAQADADRFEAEVKRQDAVIKGLEDRIRALTPPPAGDQTTPPTG